MAILRPILVLAALFAVSAPSGALALVTSGGASPSPLRSLKPRVSSSPSHHRKPTGWPTCSASGGGHGG